MTKSLGNKGEAFPSAGQLFFYLLNFYPLTFCLWLVNQKQNLITKTDSEPSQGTCNRCGHPSRPALEYENPHIWRPIIQKEQISCLEPMATAISRLLRTGAILGVVAMHKWGKTPMFIRASGTLGVVTFLNPCWLNGRWETQGYESPPPYFPSG